MRREMIKGRQTRLLRSFLVDTQKGKILFLKYECQGLSERSIRYPIEDVIIHFLEGDGLFDRMPKLVDGDIITFVIHPILTNTCPEVCLL